eukprot:g2818.t1
MASPLGFLSRSDSPASAGRTSEGGATKSAEEFASLYALQLKAYLQQVTQIQNDYGEVSHEMALVLSRLAEMMRRHGPTTTNREQGVNRSDRGNNSPPLLLLERVVAIERELYDKQRRKLLARKAKVAEGASSSSSSASDGDEDDDTPSPAKGPQQFGRGFTLDEDDLAIGEGEGAASSTTDEASLISALDHQNEAASRQPRRAAEPARKLVRLEEKLSSLEVEYQKKRRRVLNEIRAILMADFGDQTGGQGGNSRSSGRSARTRSLTQDDIELRPCGRLLENHGGMLDAMATTTGLVSSFVLSTAATTARVGVLTAADTTYSLGAAALDLAVPASMGGPTRQIGAFVGRSLFQISRSGVDYGLSVTGSIIECVPINTALRGGAYGAAAVGDLVYRKVVKSGPTPMERHRSADRWKASEDAVCGSTDERDRAAFSIGEDEKQVQRRAVDAAGANLSPEIILHPVAEILENELRQLGEGKASTSFEPAPRASSSDTSPPLNYRSSAERRDLVPGNRSPRDRAKLDFGTSSSPRSAAAEGASAASNIVASTFTTLGSLVWGGSKEADEPVELQEIRRDGKEDEKSPRPNHSESVPTAQDGVVSGRGEKAAILATRSQDDNCPVEGLQGGHATDGVFIPAEAEKIGNQSTTGPSELLLGARDAAPPDNSGSGAGYFDSLPSFSAPAYTIFDAATTATTTLYDATSETLYTTASGIQSAAEATADSLTTAAVSLNAAAESGLDLVTSAAGEIVYSTVGIVPSSVGGGGSQPHSPTAPINNVSEEDLVALMNNNLSEADDFLASRSRASEVDRREIVEIGPAAGAGRPTPSSGEDGRADVVKGDTKKSKDAETEPYEEISLSDGEKDDEDQFLSAFASICSYQQTGMSPDAVSADVGQSSHQEATSHNQLSVAPRLESDQLSVSPYGVVDGLPNSDHYLHWIVLDTTGKQHLRDNKGSGPRHRISKNIYDRLKKKRENFLFPRLVHDGMLAQQESKDESWRKLYPSSPWNPNDSPGPGGAAMVYRYNEGQDNLRDTTVVHAFAPDLREGEGILQSDWSEEKKGTAVLRALTRAYTSVFKAVYKATSRRNEQIHLETIYRVLLQPLSDKIGAVEHPEYAGNYGRRGDEDAGELPVLTCHAIAQAWEGLDEIERQHLNSHGKNNGKIAFDLCIEGGWVPHDVPKSNKDIYKAYKEKIEVYQKTGACPKLPWLEPWLDRTFQDTTHVVQNILRESGRCSTSCIILSLVLGAVVGLTVCVLLCCCCMRCAAGGCATACGVLHAVCCCMRCATYRAGSVRLGFES